MKVEVTVTTESLPFSEHGHDVRRVPKGSKLTMNLTRARALKAQGLVSFTESEAEQSSKQKGK